MPDTHETAAALRAAVDHHTNIKTGAERRHAEILAHRPGALLHGSDDDVAELDRELARLARSVDRAVANIAALAPALAAAEMAEVEADRRQTESTSKHQDRATVAETARIFDQQTAAAVGATLSGAAVQPKSISPTMFEPPPIRITRDDAGFWAAREKREREEREARLRAKAGDPAPSPERTTQSYAGLARR